MLLYLTTEVDISWFATYLQLHFFPVVMLSCCNQSSLQIFLQGLYIFTVPKWATLSLSECDKHQARWYPASRCLWKIVVVALLFKWVSLMIRFIIWVKKGLILLFWYFLNLTSFYRGKFVKNHSLKLILWYFLAHIAYVLDLSHFWWSYDGFFSVVML